MISTERFTREVRALERTLYRLAWTYVKNDPDAADAVQEAVFKAWQHRASYREDKPFRAWLARIVINECRNIQRQRMRVLPMETVEPRDAGGTDCTALQNAIEALDENLRIPLLLHYLEGFDLREIAGALGIPVGTVKWRLHKARTRLQQQLSEEEFS